MQEYKEAFQNLQVPKDMRERIVARLNQTSDEIIDLPVRSQKHIVRNLAALAACVAVVAISFLAYPKAGQELTDPGLPADSLVQPNAYDESPELCNPMHKMEDFASLQAALPFTLEVPAQLPHGYVMESAHVIAGTLAQINYMSGEEMIRYRMAQGNDDVSGDFNHWESAVERAEAGRDIVLKGNGDSVSLATWTFDGNSYSLSFSAGMKTEDVLEIISQVGPIES